MILYVPLIPTCEPLINFFSGSAPVLHRKQSLAIQGSIATRKQLYVRTTKFNMLELLIIYYSGYLFISISRLLCRTFIIRPISLWEETRMAAYFGGTRPTYIFLLHLYGCWERKSADRRRANTASGKSIEITATAHSKQRDARPCCLMISGRKIDMITGITRMSAGGRVSSLLFCTLAQEAGENDVKTS